MQGSLCYSSTSLVAHEDLGGNATVVMFLSFPFQETEFTCVALAILEISSVDQGGLYLIDLPACVSPVLGFKVPGTTT